MGQIAYRVGSGEIMEAFSASDAEWEAVCSAPGQLSMPRTGWPAVPKTSIRGLRFFAHHSGYPHKLPAPESYAHTRLKIDVVKSARRLGYKAGLEVAGSDPSGQAWIADVLVETADNRKVAFEIQLSSQHVEDFRIRTARYTRSGVSVCWLMSESPVASRLQKAIVHENIEYFRLHGDFQSDCEEIVPFAVDLKGKDDYPTELPPVRFGRGDHLRRMRLDEVIDGVLKGYPRWELPDWKWDDTLRKVS